MKISRPPAHVEDKTARIDNPGHRRTQRKQKAAGASVDSLLGFHVGTYDHLPQRHGVWLVLFGGAGAFPALIFAMGCGIREAVAEVSPADAVCDFLFLPLVSVLLIGRFLDSRGRFHWQNPLHRMTFVYAIFQAMFGFSFWLNWCGTQLMCTLR